MTAEIVYEYGFYDSEYGPNPIVWACFGLPFKDAAMARHTAVKSVWGQPVIVRRQNGSIAVWELVEIAETETS